MSRKSPLVKTPKDSIDGFLQRKWTIILLIFLISVSIRVFTLNRIGKTWDEPPYVELGYKYVELIKNRDFSNSYWFLQSDHPPLARYIYGVASILDREMIQGKETFRNTYTFARFVSVVVGSLTIVFIILLGYKYFSPFVGFSSGLIFALIPFFVGLSQLATLESFIMLFFTATVFFFLWFLDEQNLKNLVFAGIFLGCSILVKQSNLILIPLLIFLAFVHVTFYKKSGLPVLRKHLKSIVLLILVAGGTIFVFWPMPFFHMQEIWEVQNKMWVKDVKLPPPEVFFGRLMLVPFPYYLVMFVITTPFLLILLAAIGVLRIDKKRTFISISVLFWFLLPFLQTLYSFKQHGIRYIIEVYAPFSLLCGIGLEYFSDKFLLSKKMKMYALGFVVIYLLFALWKVAPYYLDYFNEVVGGNNYVYQHRLFQMGWWGQGIEEAANYISNNEKKVVTVAVDGPQPASVMPRLWNIRTVYYDKIKTFDYVLVPYFNVVRLKFPEGELLSEYRKIHSVMVDRAELVKIYKHK